MKKRFVSGLLLAAMTTAMLTGCGSKDDAGSSSKVEISDGGKVLNIYVWNDEFITRLAENYPGYEAIDATSGKIGDVTVKFNVTANQDNAYQNNLDSMLEKQDSAAADDKIDIFLVEADYALKYVDTSYTVPVTELGISEDSLKNQYQYTKDIVTDSNGVLKGLSWQGCPGVMFYNRDAAKAVWGTDDPATVQSYVSDWTKFYETASTMKENGYQMVSSVNDTFRVYSNNVTSKWVEDGKINIDENIMAWVENSKAMVDAGQAGTHDLWSDDWSKGFFPDGNVFCYFGPAWFINYSMSADVEGSIGYNGGWGAVEGPQGFYWGGTWICACNGTDNKELVKDIMLKLTTDEDIMKGIVTKYDDFVNNKPAMEAMATSDYSSKILGGQNPLSMYCVSADKISLKYSSSYDQGCVEEFQKAIKNYFTGNATLDEAIELFKDNVIVKYPDLKK